MMSNRRVWALTILLSGFVSIPHVWGSIPARLQAAAATRGTTHSRLGRLTDTKSISRAPAAVSSQHRSTRVASASDTPTLDMPALETLSLETLSLDAPNPEMALLVSPVLESAAPDENENGSLFEATADDLPPALEPVHLESLVEDPVLPLTARVHAPSRVQLDENSAAKPPIAATKTAKSLSPEMTRLRNRIRTCLSYYFQHATSIDERSPWGVMHSLIAFGVDTELVADNKRVNAIGWLCYNRPCKGMTLMTVQDGQLIMRQNGPGYQGHDGQLLSMLALSGVMANYPIRVEGHEFTVADLVTFEQLHCKPKTELTFQLTGLVHYLPSDATWKDKAGGNWSISRLIREEITQPVNGAACGGTHRLIGLSMAAKTRQKRNEPLDGEWLRAQKLVVSYQQHAFKLQNRDGSFSTSWLAKRDDSGDLDRRIQTSGHILEWLIFSLPEKDLTDPRMVKGISYLTNRLMENERDWEIGPRGHALRALALYNERVFGDKPGERRELLARRPGK